MKITRTMPVAAARRLRLNELLPETIRCNTVTVVVYAEQEEYEDDDSDDDPDNGYAATLAACQEARDIMSGKIPSKVYTSVDEYFDEIEAEIAAEKAAERGEAYAEST
jgi:hypothetical protein